MKIKSRPVLTLLSCFLSVLTVPIMILSTVVPQILFVVPMYISFLYAYVGMVSAAAAVVISCVLLFVVCGWGAGLFAALFLFPVFLSLYITTGMKKEFWISCAVTGAASFLAMCAVVSAASLIAGTDTVSAISSMMKDNLKQLGYLADPMLLKLADSGIIEKPEGIFLSGKLLLSSARNEMIQSLVTLLDSGLRLEIPAQMLCTSIVVGIYGQALCRWGIARRGGENLDRPLMREWMIPSGWGRILGGTLALFAILYYVGFTSAGFAYTIQSAFIKVFAIQGVSAVLYLFDKKGIKKVWKLLFFILGITAFSTGACVVGLMDQVADVTRRRADLGERKTETA